MNLLLFTPTLTTSPIAHMMVTLTKTLMRQGHNITIVRSEQETLLSQPALDFGTAMLPWHHTLQLIHLLKTTDGCIYQMGDSYADYQGSVYWLHSMPGIVCLHEPHLQRLFLEWASNHPKDALAILKTWYPKEIATQYCDAHNQQQFIATLNDTIPITKWICAMAAAIITPATTDHSLFQDATFGPIKAANLDYNDTLSIEHYAQILIDLSEELLSTRPILQAIHYLYATINRWSGDPDLLLAPDLMNPLQIFSNLSTHPLDH